MPFCQSVRKRSYRVDSIYHNVLVQIMVYRVIRNGKKSLSYRIFYCVLEQIKKDIQRPPLALLEHAIRAVTPSVHLKGRRLGGRTYQVPIEIRKRRAAIKAIQWIIKASRNRPRPDIRKCISAEILNAAQSNGGAARKQREVHRMAEANKAFVRYRFHSQLN